jgi:mRNA interferase RelE/StbE
MGYEIVWSISAAKQMKKLDRSIAKRIYEKVDLLHQNPERYVEGLVNSPYYRLRVGDFRLILDIQSQKLNVLILKVGHRNNIYQR